MPELVTGFSAVVLYLVNAAVQFRQGP